MSRFAPALVSTLAILLGACAAQVEPYDFHGEEDGDLAISADGLTLSGLGRGCSTAGTEGISAQLLEEMQCLSDGALVPVSHPNVVPTSSRVHLYLSPEGRDALLSVAASREVRINSALRTIAEQYVLGRGCSVAAAPGRSNHETGRAIDVQNYGSVGPALQRAGFSRPLPSSDPVHYVAPGDDLRRLSVLAFQRLWNANHPEDRIGEDGVAGSQTTSRLSRSPSEGFPVGGPCSATPAPAPAPAPTPAPEPEPTPSPSPAPSGASCTHSYGGTYGHLACSGSYQCCDGRWRTRGAGCGECTCVEGTGATGCGVEAPPPPPPSTGASCAHSYGGTYGHLACSASYQCCDGTWRDRSSGCGTCACVESSGTSGCGL
ncbi:MAG: M15 family metallopeptidase [Sandaracinaceae bacterium]